MTAIVEANTCPIANASNGVLYDTKECGNCGATENLLVCSRCHNAYFCSASCQRSYWPFHKSECRKNEFADAIEKDDPKFARWMRRHRKLAVLKDDEVDRLERAQNASIGPSRSEVMNSMYGRLNPKPLPPTYSPEEILKMKTIEESEKRQKLMLSEREKHWSAIVIDPILGLDCSSSYSSGGCLPYKWNQNQTFVEIHIHLPASLPVTQYRQKIKVNMTPDRIDIIQKENDENCDDIAGMHSFENKLWGGELFQEIKVDESTWLIRDSILELTLLKRSRRGYYANGHTNADTFWYSLFKDATSDETVDSTIVPAAYYKSFFEGSGINGNLHKLRGRAGYRPMIKNKK